MMVDECRSVFHTVLRRVTLVWLVAGSTIPGQSPGSGIPMDFQRIAARSSIRMTPPSPLAGAYPLPAVISPLTNVSRGWEAGDVDGDGFADIVVTPSYLNWKPLLPLQIWRGDGKGKFVEATSSILTGPPPAVGSANNVWITDLNGDGRNDVFIVDQGLEDVDCRDGCSGGSNHVLLSQPSGQLRDATAASLAGQPNRFNHVSAMADLNADGAPDVVLAIIGGRTPPGVALLMNDGKGRFTETVRGLPPEIAWTPTWKFNVPFQGVGAVGAGDLDGDGIPEIATASYNSGDWVVGADGKGGSLLSERTIRVFRANRDGAYTEAWRSRIPDEIAGIPYLGDGSGGLGAASIQIADLDQDGRSDLLVLWENGGGRPNYVEFLKNQGNLQFADMTLRLFGTYQSRGANTIQLSDTNGDGIPDFQLREANFETAALATARTPLLLNDGLGHLLPLQPGDSGRTWTSAEMVAALGPPCPRLADCVWVRSLPLMFDLNGDGVRDLVLIDHGMQYSPPPGVQGTVDVYTLLAQPPPATVPSALTPTGGNRQRASINTAYFSRLQATVRDSSRRAVANVTVTFRAPSAGASGVFAGAANVATVVTNAAGIATAPIFTANDFTGPYQILAEAPGINLRATFSLTNIPSRPVTGAVNVAGGGSDIAQNSWVEIRGTNLVPEGIPGSGLDWSGAPEFSSGRLPESLPELPITVAVNGRPAYVYFVCRAAASSRCAMDQMNVLTPLDDALGVVPVVVTAGGVSSEPFMVKLRAAAPGFPLVGGTKYLVATHADYSLVGPRSLSTPGYRFAPASPGEIITMYGFGFGLPTTPLTPGSSSQSGSLPIPPTVEIGGVPASVIFAGVVSPGLYQLNVRVPDTLEEGDHSFRCIYAGFISAAGPLVAVGR